MVRNLSAIYYFLLSTLYSLITTLCSLTMTHILALIPARGGSKGIPRKNIRDFAGFPLIAWSVAAGLQAHTVNRVIVSTDNEMVQKHRSRVRLKSPKTAPLTYRFLNMRSSGWRISKATSLISLFNCVPHHPSARKIVWIALSRS
jgi:hypothetical protein